MRTSLKELIKNTVLFEYSLPNNDLKIGKTNKSTNDDACYSTGNSDDLAKIIYNSVIEYAFNEYEISESSFDVLHRRALLDQLHFNFEAADESKLKYGFYGEVLLYCILYIYFKAPPIIARGYFYNCLENSETKGFDSYHLVENGSTIELWFGEVKFYADYKAATTGANGALTNLTKAISDDYLNKNLHAISGRSNDLATSGSNLKPILNDIKNKPEIKISELAEKYELKLVYPIFLLFDKKNKSYDDLIREVVSHIDAAILNDNSSVSVDVSLFFVLEPVDNAKYIKTKVLEWIKDKEPLMP